MTLTHISTVIFQVGFSANTRKAVSRCEYMGQTTAQKIPAKEQQINWMGPNKRKEKPFIDFGRWLRANKWVHLFFFWSAPLWLSFLFTQTINNKKKKYELNKFSFFLPHRLLLWRPHFHFEYFVFSNGIDPISSWWCWLSLAMFSRMAVDSKREKPDGEIWFRAQRELSIHENIHTHSGHLGMERNCMERKQHHVATTGKWNFNKFDIRLAVIRRAQSLKSNQFQSQICFYV